MTTVTRYAVRNPLGKYLSGKGGGRYSWKFSDPKDASLWNRKATATQAANWFKSGDGRVVEVEVLLP
jgi:hypothetical protein